MAFLFGGEKGEADAKKIFAHANNLLTNKDKREYIEKEIKQRAIQVDNDFHTGIKEVFNGIDKESSSKGAKAGFENIFALMTEKLGLNIDKDNMQTHFDPGPPQIFQVSWVNRPTKNLAEPNSDLNKLANLYSSTLNAQDQKKFDETLASHAEQAKIGGPKIDKDEFLKLADQSFEDTKQRHKLGANANQEDLDGNRPSSPGMR